MYKIYTNETPLYLVSTSDAKNFGPNSDTVLVLRHTGKRKYLLNIIDKMEKSHTLERVVIFHSDVEELWADYKGAYKIIEAAGGVVFNEKNQVLAIYRRDFWDLPKGKIDEGETPEMAAVREVQEETGLHDVTLGEHLTDTWHTYKIKKKRILKRTYWYRMHTPETDLTPQTEEDIEIAEWKTLEEMKAIPSEKIYGSIREVLQNVGRLT